MTTIKLKNGSGAPTTGDLVQGEPALDLTNKRLYTEDSGGTVIEVGTNPTSITTGDITATGTATFANLATSGDVTFGDNDKAIFGAGSDLQIYHDGTYNFINAASGQFIFMQADELRLRSSTSETYFAATLNGATTLYYDASSKLSTTSTGIDVTGTVTADGLTVDGNATLQGASSPTLNITDTDTPTTAFISSTNSSARFGSSTNTDVFWMSNNTLRTQIDGATGDISFYDSSGSSQNLFWDASTSRLGLGTTSPAYELHIEDASGNAVVNIESSTTGYSAVNLGDTNNDDVGQIKYDNSTNSMQFTTNASERMRIDSSGNVGIGTQSPAVRLQTNVANASTEAIRITNDADSVRTHILPAEFQAQNSNLTLNAVDGFATVFKTTNTERMRINSSGNVGIGTASPSYKLTLEDSLPYFRTKNTSAPTDEKTWDYNAGTDGIFRFRATNDAGNTSNNWLTVNRTGATIDYIAMHTASGTERMRIDSSGNLLVGTTNPSATTSAGIKLTKPTTSGNDDGKLIITGETSTSAQDAFQIYSTGASAYRCFINYAGSIYATSTSITAISDESLKENIRDLDKGLDTVLALQPRRFDWKNGDGNDIMGFVAQEVEEVMPELVHDFKYSETETKLGLKMGDMVPTLVKAIQDQQEIIENLKSRIEQLEGAN